MAPRKAAPRKAAPLTQPKSPTNFVPVIVGDLPPSNHKGRPVSEATRLVMDLADANVGSWIMAQCVFIDQTLNVATFKKLGYETATRQDDATTKTLYIRKA